MAKIAAVVTITFPRYMAVLPFQATCRGLAPRSSLASATFGGLTPGSSVKATFGGLTPGSSVKATFGGLTPGSSIKATFGGLTPGSSIKATFGGLTPGSSIKATFGGLTPGSSDSANPALDTAQQANKAIRLTFIFIRELLRFVCLMSELTQTAESWPPAN
jgi:hypothetical protein